MLNTEKEYEHMLKVLRFFLVAFFLFVLLSISKFSCAQADSSNTLKIEYKGYSAGAYNLTLTNLTQCLFRVTMKWNARDSIILLSNKDVLQLSLTGAFIACSSIKAIPSNNCEGKSGDTLTVLMPCTLAIRNDPPAQVNRQNQYPATYEVYTFSGQYVNKIRVNNPTDIKRYLNNLPAAAYILKGADTRVIFHHQ